MRLGFALCSTLALAVTGCSSDISLAPVPTISGGSPAPRAVATDTRQPVVAATPPPPISGGTLIVTHDGNFAVAADPDRDRVSIVSVQRKAVLATIALNAGDEPGRIAEDATGVVHVALRRGGAVVAIDPQSGTLLRRTSVCGAPRGIAYEPATKLLHVACAGGELVSLPAAGGDPVRTLHFDPDLRDVAVTPAGLVVSRFKSVTFMRLDRDGNVIQNIATQGIGRTVVKTVVRSGPSGSVMGQSGPVAERLAPSVAWRTVASPTGEVLSLHQYALAETINVGQHSSSEPTIGGSQPYGVPPATSCGGGLVTPVVSMVNGAGQVLMGAQMGGPVLAVDLSVSPDGAWVALAHAGTPDPNAPNANNLNGGPVAAPSLGTVTVTQVPRIPGQDPNTPNCVPPDFSFDVAGQATAVAFNPNVNPATIPLQNTWLVAQTREPAQLVFVRDPGLSDPPTPVALGGPSVLDTGHELFHRDSGAGVACAECHAEGGEDGRVWKFSPTGDRRTQALHVGIAGTEPFHWDGDMTNLGVLMDEVFVRRMGGPHQSPDRLAALETWLSALKPPAPIGDPTSPEAIAGKALFESSEVGCISCHSGEKHTNNLNEFVGTTANGHTLQVPSLVGVGYRAPFIHNGCAATLRDRFDPACGGGDSHGKTSALSEEQLTDLVAYLRTL